MNQQALEIDMKERKVTRTINVKLSPTEKAQVMDDYNSIRDEMDKAELDFACQKETHKAALTELEASAEKTRLRAKNGDARDVECMEKSFFGTNIVQVWHEDTMLEERAMTAQERQMEIGELKHGVVQDAEFSDGRSFSERTPEEQRTDIAETMAEEHQATKPSLVM